MKDVVRVLETAAAFVPDASATGPSAANRTAANLMYAAAEPVGRLSAFEDPFASNPFATGTPEAAQMHSPLHTGPPGAALNH